MKRTLSFLLGLLLATGLAMLTSCSTVEQGLAQLSLARTPAAALDSSAAAAGLQPAPAELTASQARRYYAAQVAAQKATTPRKVKNSGNSTVHQQQKITNVSPTILLLIVSLALLLGVVVGGVLGIKYAPQRRILTP